MSKLDKNTKDILLHLVGKEIEHKDQHGLWLAYKDEHLENIDKDIMTRRTALKAYTKFRRIKTYE